MFIHYLITRFNIKVSQRGPETMDSPDMNLEWLSERMHLFKKYCAPSVLEQVNTKFTWLIYLNPDTPITIMQQLEFLIKCNIKTELVFANDYEQMIKDIVGKIKNAPSPYVITSRLDNDDIISRFFIRDVQKSFKPHHSTIINFNSGFEYSTLDRVLKKWNTRHHNQFISIIEEKEAPEIHSIYGFPHWGLPRNSEIINISGQVYWIYLRHDLNYSGSAITGIPYFLKLKALDMFPLSMRRMPISFINTFQYATKWLPAMLKRRYGSTKKK